MRIFTNIPISQKEHKKFFKGFLCWAQRFNEVSYLYSNDQSTQDKELIAGIGSVSSTNDFSGKDSFDKIGNFHDSIKDWAFGHLGYDLKNELEQLSSGNFDGIKFSDSCFFQPKYVFILTRNHLQIGYLTRLDNEKSIKKILEDIFNSPNDGFPERPNYSVKSRIEKNEYIARVKKIQEHIQRGDIYETNFCGEFYIENTQVDPVTTYLDLNEISQTPFSAFYKQTDTYLMCASPERFLKKTGKKLLSQPIKGTIRRGKTAPEDIALKEQLFMNEKERNENVMIVDLVRNDLSKCAAPGTVKVDELFGIYTFSQVHQMISSISCELKPGIHWTEALRNTFPMGSMTGAPKLRAMQLAEQYESTKRGLYSGALGYITPEGDFDFNVVIRSILYNKTNNYVSFMTGSAITAQSDPEKEYEECLLKAKAMFEVLTKDQKTMIEL